MHKKIMALVLLCFVTQINCMGGDNKREVSEYEDMEFSRIKRRKITPSSEQQSLDDLLKTLDQKRKPSQLWKSQQEQQAFQTAVKHCDYFNKFITTVNPNFAKKNDNYFRQVQNVYFLGNMTTDKTNGWSQEKRLEAKRRVLMFWQNQKTTITHMNNQIKTRLPFINKNIK